MTDVSNIHPVQHQRNPLPSHACHVVNLYRFAPPRCNGYVVVVHISIMWGNALIQYYVTLYHITDVDNYPQNHSEKRQTVPFKILYIRRLITRTKNPPLPHRAVECLLNTINQRGLK